MIFGGRLYANRSGACKAGYSSRTGTAVKIRTSDQLRGQSRPSKSRLLRKPGAVSGQAFTA